MRILYVLHDFFPRFYGGTERYVLNLAHQMQRMGHQAEVLTYGLDEPDGAFSGAVGAMLERRYVWEGVGVTSLRHRDVPSTIGHRIADDEVTEAVGLFLDSTPVDLVHIAHPMRLAAGIRAIKARSLPLVLTLTDFWLLCPRGRMYKPDYSPCNSPERGQKCVRECNVEASIRERYGHARALFEEADALIAPSSFLIDIFRRCGWERAITQISHGVDYRNVSPLAPRRGGGKIHIGYIGVVNRFKGVDALLKAFMAASSPNLVLKVYGNIVWDQRLRQELSAAYGGDPRIHLLNRYDHDELPLVMADVDVMVVPSTTLESYGLVVVESLAYGVPVVATDMVGSAHEFIRNDVNGYIYPAAKPETLRAILDRIATEPEILPRLRAGIVLPPRIEEEAYQVESVYRTLVR